MSLLSTLIDLLKKVVGRIIRRKIYKADAEEAERIAHDALDDFSRRD